MYAAIDVGSNTLRMLIGRCLDGHFQPTLYRQQITRLAGGFTVGSGLAQVSIERTLSALIDFIEITRRHQVEKTRIVGTAALRRAENAKLLLNQLKLKSRLELEIIDGTEEARLSAAGALSVLQSNSESQMIVDIGGGSTELILYDNQQMLFSRSYPLGVVRLCEEMSDLEDRQLFIKDMVVKFSADLLHAGISPQILKRCELIGTAGTFTSLVALDLQMISYDREQVNNHQLCLTWLEKILEQLSQMSVADREEMPGLEPGRGDVIMPGLELIIALCRYFQRTEIRVVDAGLLEGILLDFCRH